MHGTQPGGRVYRITAATLVALVVLGAGVTFTVARASNDPDARARAVRKIVLQDEDWMNPSTLTMDAGDALEFENDSGELIRFIFVEPRDQNDKIRCYLTDHTIARPDQMSWLIFQRGPGGRLTATMPLGTFASACSLAPGQYTFVTKRVPRDRRAVLDQLGIRARSPCSREIVGCRCASDMSRRNRSRRDDLPLGSARYTAQSAGTPTPGCRGSSRSR